MILLNIPLGLAGLFGVQVLLFVLATLSRRLGEVTKMRPYYRGFYVAMLGVLVAMLATVLQPDGADDGLFIAVYTLSLLASGLIGLAVAYRYWGWLFRERHL